MGPAMEHVFPHQVAESRVPHLGDAQGFAMVVCARAVEHDRYDGNLR